MSSHFEEKKLSKDEDNIFFYFFKDTGGPQCAGFSNFRKYINMETQFGNIYFCHFQGHERHLRFQINLKKFSSLYFEVRKGHLNISSHFDYFMVTESIPKKL